MFKKAYELSTLCDIKVWVLYYGRDGELIKTCPENKTKVRDMTERFSQLTDIEKRKKSSNLSEFLAKKMSKDKKDDFNKFTQKLLEMKYSLERCLPILQEQSTMNRTIVESSQCELPPILQDQLPPHEEVSSDYGIPQPLINSSTSPVVDPPHHQWTEPLVRLMSSMNHHHDHKKFSIFLYNHENGNFTQLASSFDQSFKNLSSTDLLGAHGFGGWNNNNNIIDLPPPPMHISFDQSTFPFSNLMSQGFDGCNNYFVDLPPPLMMMQTFPSSYY
ncbi:unnamed protein product [Arabis nemorensis]|uniref:MADS-box domain-containing protein n=1 Tax=Arabis nemorensis TaxID=586526 RepID=A0A565CNQ2_9BRAS|nr:unnamed protein product [Arabis nemorensis]